MTKALVVLSGGQDSATCLAMAIKEHGIENVHAVTFYYGQKHLREILLAQMLVEKWIHEPISESLNKDIELPDGVDWPTYYTEMVASRWHFVDLSFLQAITTTSSLVTPPRRGGMETIIRTTPGPLLSEDIVSLKESWERAEQDTESSIVVQAELPPPGTPNANGDVFPPNAHAELSRQMRGRFTEHISKGTYVGYSMGAKVERDKCTICGCDPLTVIAETHVEVLSGVYPVPPAEPGFLYMSSDSDPRIHDPVCGPAMDAMAQIPIEDVRPKGEPITKLLSAEDEAIIRRMSEEKMISMGVDPKMLEGDTAYATVGAVLDTAVRQELRRDNPQRVVKTHPECVPGEVCNACEIPEDEQPCNSAVGTEVTADNLADLHKNIDTALSEQGYSPSNKGPTIGNQPSSFDSSLPDSFVPGRNLIFLSVAASLAANLGCDEIWTGVCQTDYSGYPDCREGFIGALQLATNAALGGGGASNFIEGFYPEGASLEVEHGNRISFVTPLMHMTKEEEVRALVDLDFHKRSGDRYPFFIDMMRYSHTCYEGQYPPCGKCPACKLRAKGFEDTAGYDPLTHYSEKGVITAHADDPITEYTMTLWYMLEAQLPPHLYPIFENLVQGLPFTRGTTFQG